MKVRYRRSTVEVDGERRKICDCCKKVAKKIDVHHWRYEFSTDEVRKNPILVMKNTSQLCFRCHRIADSMRHIFENPELSDKLVCLMREAMVKK
jgi:hypothetical protein